MNINLLLELAKEKKLDLNLSYRQVTKGTKILKRIALAMESKPDELLKLFSEDGAAFFSKLNSFIADEYDDERDIYGALSLQLLGLIKDISKSDEPIEDMQIFEIFEKINQVINSIKGEGQESFLTPMDTTLPSTTEQLATTESVT